MSRPRSLRAHNRVLEATLKLFAERGIDRTSMDAVAEASGVSKATIYKHWPRKDALALEVLARLHGLDDQPPAPDSDDLRADLVAALSLRQGKRRWMMHDRMLPHFMAYAARNPAFGQAWRARVMEPPRRRLAQLLQRGIAKGQLPADLDLDLAVALMIGPMMYSHVLKTMKRKVPGDMPQCVVEAFWKAHAVRGAKDTDR
jgi:AcrR family transcriptional regulator